MTALAACVLGDGSSWLARRDGDVQPLLDAADVHGVLPLVAERAGRLGFPDDWTTALRLRHQRAAAADLVRERELRALVGAFGRAGVTPLVVKGAALAYTAYARPDLRPRVDTDLLVDAAERRAAERVLEEQGYRAVPQLEADLVMYQRPFEKRRGTAAAHMVDLHWRLSNPQRFGSALTHDDLRRQAVPLARLHASALGPSPVHALLLSCVHRVAHHHDEPRLIWSYDIHLLASALSWSDWEDVVRIASDRRIAGVCTMGLESSRALFQTPIPPDVPRQLAEGASREPSLDAYLNPGQPHIVRFLSDLRAMGSWREAVRLTRQHMLPSSAYMRQVYAPASSAPLPVLYARRAWRGARRWLTRP